MGRSGAHARTGGDEAQALGDERLREHRARRCTVSRALVRLRGYLYQQLRSGVRPRIVKLDVTGDGDAVVDDLGDAKAPLKHHVTPLGTQRHLDSVGHGINPRQQRFTARVSELDLCGHAGRRGSHRRDPPDLGRMRQLVRARRRRLERHARREHAVWRRGAVF